MNTTHILIHTPIDTQTDKHIIDTQTDTYRVTHKGKDCKDETKL